jgi:hypothetical protein
VRATFFYFIYFILSLCLSPAMGQKSAISH